MRKAVKDKLVERIKAVETLQPYFLKVKEGRFSVLGLLCDLAAEDGVGQWVPPDPKKRNDLTIPIEERLCHKFVTSTEELCYLPEEVRKWACLYDHTLRTYKTDPRIVSLYAMNNRAAAKPMLLKMLNLFEDTNAVPDLVGCRYEP